MADQRENIEDPTGLGTIFEDVADANELQHDAFEGQREVDHLFDEEFTDDTEQHTSPLHVVVGNAPAEASEAESQPKSAFSASSSDEDSDADDEGAEEDEEGDDSDQAEEWEDSNTDNRPPTPPAEQIVVAPAVWGVRHKDNTEYLLRVNYKNEDSLYHSSSSDSGKYRRKKDQHRKVMSNRVVRPSPLRTTSNPDSPTSPENKEATIEIGVLPEPSPEAEGNYIVSPLSDHDVDPMPESVSEQLSPTTKRDWSEEDEEDMSWNQDAIAEVKGSSQESEDELVKIPSPVSPLEGADASDIPTDYPSQSSDLFLETGSCDALSEDGKAVSLEAPSLDSAGSHETAEAPEGFQPTFVTTRPKFYDPTSPDPDGPDILTGLNPREGFDAWKEWHERNDTEGQRFRTNYIITDDDGKSGDLNVGDAGARSDAADYLRKQRLLFKENKAGYHQISGIVLAPHGSTTESRIADCDNIFEFMKLLMYKYRFQRNFFRYEFKISERNLQDSKDRIDRRDKKIAELDDRIDRRDGSIQELDEMVYSREERIKEHEEYIETLIAKFDDAYTAWEEEKAKRKRLQDEYKKLHMFSDQYQKSAEQNAEKLRRNRAERDADFEVSSIMTVISQEPDAISPGNASDFGSNMQDSASSQLAQRALELEAALEKLAVRDSEELNNAVESQMQVDAEEVRLYLQNKDKLEDNLAASRSYSEQLQSRNNELEVELESSRKTTQANASSISELSDLVHAAEQHARDQQTRIEDLMAHLEGERAAAQAANYGLGDIVASREDFDKSAAGPEAKNSTLLNELDAERQENKTLREEAMALWDAVRQHRIQFPSSPLPSAGTTLFSSQRTQSAGLTSPISVWSSVKAIPSPLRDPQQQQQQHRKADFNRPCSWAVREKAILQQQNVTDELESRRVVRQTRQAVELGRLDQIRERMDSIVSTLGVSEMPYIPLAGRFLSILA